MIPAYKSLRFTRWFARDASKRIARSFDTFRVRGLEELRGELGARPVLVVTNHTSWWDPLVALVASARLAPSDAYAMMDAKNLARVPFFGKVGAFGVDLDDARDGARAIRYAAKLLNAPGRLIWIFAQGREVPVTVRPLGFRPGSAEIARLARRAVVVPGALRYEMGSTPLPTLWLSFGAALEREADVGMGQEVHEAAVARELDRIEAAISGEGAESFRVVTRCRPSPWFSVAERLLAWFTRPRQLSPARRPSARPAPPE